MKRSRGAVPKIASISGAAASRSGVTTRMSPGRSPGWLGEQAEQVVLQHLQLARQRMADMHFDAAVASRPASPSRARVGADRASRSAAARAGCRPAAGSKKASSSAPSPPSSSSASTCACVCLPQVASRRLPSSCPCAWPRAARWLRRRRSTRSNQYSRHGLSTYRCTSISADAVAAAAGAAAPCPAARTHARRAAGRRGARRAPPPRCSASTKACAGCDACMPSSAAMRCHSAACQASSCDARPSPTSAGRPSRQACSQSGR